MNEINKTEINEVAFPSTITLDVIFIHFMNVDGDKYDKYILIRTIPYFPKIF